MEYHNDYYVNARRRFLGWFILLVTLCAQPGLIAASSPGASPAVAQDDLETRIDALSARTPTPKMPSLNSSATIKSAASSF
jgi:hypothetical protein